MKRLFLLSVFLYLHFSVIGQDDTVRHADIGLRFTSSEFNRFQLEFRKPIGDHSFFRIGSSLGFQFNYPGRDIFDANDSIVTTRQKDRYGNHYDLRFGFERTISYEWLSFHADFVCSYNVMTTRHWNYYHVLDSTGTDWKFTHTNPYTGVEQDSAMAVTSYIGGGLVLGLSFNFPITENFILNFTGSYTGILRFSVGEKEVNDKYDEFNYYSSSSFELYSTAGIGLRYMFGQSQSSERNLEH